MTRKLATIRQIAEIRPIPNADSLELAIIDGWQAVVHKGEFKEGAIVIYCEIDSFLPIQPEYEFLRKNCYRQLADGTEGFRIRTMKLRGELSQGLVLPLPEHHTLEVGSDVTELLGVTKYEVPIGTVAIAAGIKRAFPTFIPKTDEERIQNMNRKLPEMLKRTWVVTEKLDGTSFTCYWYKGEFGVCSRNWEIEKGAGIDIVRQKGLDKLNPENYFGDIAIQGEIVGARIQGNKYNLADQQLFVFNVFDIDQQKYLNQYDAMRVAEKLNLQYVPVIKHNFNLPESIKEILSMAEGKSQLNPATEREGLVFVSDDAERISFKAISNKFLLKEKD